MGNSTSSSNGSKTNSIGGYSVLFQVAQVGLWTYANFSSLGLRVKAKSIVDAVDDQEDF